MKLGGGSLFNVYFVFYLADWKKKSPLIKLDLKLASMLITYRKKHIEQNWTVKQVK